MPSDYLRITQDNIRRRGEEFDDIGELLSRQLYSDRTHFVYELLQNAEDALLRRSKSAPQCDLPRPIAFHLYRDRLEVRHYGQVFDEQDVRGVSDVLKGTKHNELDQIGKFGIGFKSVYAFTASPEIHSGEEHFRIERYIRPRGIAPCQAKPGETVFVFPFNHANVSSEMAMREIGDRLKTLSGRTLLFLRHIDRIEWHFDDRRSGSYRRKETTRGTAREVTVITESDGRNEEEKWLLFQRPVPIPNTSSSVAVEIAFKLGKDKGDKDGRIVKLLKSPLVVFFPTDKDTRLGFLLQASYRTTPARDNVPEHDDWNRKLVPETATLITGALSRLKELQLLTVGVLEALPISADDFPPDSMFYPVFTAVKEALIAHPLLPADDGTFVSAREAALPGAAWLREILSDTQLQQLFDSKTALRWMTHLITEGTTRALWDYLTDVLSVKEVSQERFASAASKEFLSSQSDAWMTKFYAKLTGVESLWKHGPLRRQPILRLEDGKHVVPFRDDGSPHAYLPPLDGHRASAAWGTMRFVRQCLATDKESREFLKRLGIPEPDVVHEVLEVILPNYEAGRVAVTAIKEHLADVQKIQRAMRADARNNKWRLEQAVRNQFWVLASNGVTGEEAFRSPDRVYLRSPELLAYFDGNSDAWFAHPYPNDILAFLVEVGVAKAVRIKCRSPEYDGSVRITDTYGWHVKGLNGFDSACEIEGLERAIENAPPDRARYIWNKLLVPNWTLIRGTVLSSTRQGFPREATTERYDFSTMGKLVAHKAWLPTENGQMRSPFQMQLRLLPDGFERDRNLVQLFEMRDSVGDGACDEATKLRYATALGINLDVVEAVKSHPEVIEVIKHNLRDFQEWMRQRAATESNGSEFPERTSRDSERRAEKLKDDLDAAPDKEYEVRERRVRISANKSEHTTWLREQYTHNDCMFCQVCQREMPFRKRDGKHYFEAVESFLELGIEHRCFRLALCPLCAAKYKEFLKREPQALARFRAAVIDAASPIVPYVWEPNRRPCASSRRTSSIFRHPFGIVAHPRPSMVRFLRTTQANRSRPATRAVLWRTPYSRSFIN